MRKRRRGGKQRRKRWKGGDGRGRGKKVDGEGGAKQNEVGEKEELEKEEQK